MWWAFQCARRLLWACGCERSEMLFWTAGRCMSMSLMRSPAAIKVYQENIYCDKPFVSLKKVVRDLGESTLVVAIAIARQPLLQHSCNEDRDGLQHGRNAI